MTFTPFLSGCDLIEAFLAPKADLWARWEAHDETARESIDHSAWAVFLRSYLMPDARGINRLVYGKVSERDRVALREYLGRLGTVPISRYSRAEQLAFWVNFYNALTVNLILSHYPVESILDIRISPGLLGYGPWDKHIVEVEGESLSLNDIEHRILRPIWRDARIHYVVNCAAVGCPNLPARPLTARTAEAMLDAGARAYINQFRGAILENGKLSVSKIYNWFSEDFGTKDREIIRHLMRYAQPSLAERLSGTKKISGYHYDWALNGAVGN
ncbi:MAG: DUF547 domain-containing protein [SAR324 cluster bacterium]|nr:DUF547 domain-containing protein [SAR324 cluster bacterium]